MNVVTYSDLKMHGIKATVTDNGQLHLVGPQAALTSEAVSIIRANKLAIIDEIKNDVNVVKVVNIESHHYKYAKNQRTNGNLEKAVVNICNNLEITPKSVMNELSQDDKNDWNNNDIDIETLTVFSRSLIQRREMNQGIIPKDYIHHAICRGCGPVWLWFPGEVQGCPWCWNRAKGWPVPHP